MALIVGVALALALLSLAVVVYPFAMARRGSRQSHQGNVETENRSENRAAQADLEEIYASIETLRLEHQLGNIPLGLYQEQLKAYRLDAARALRRKSQAENSDPDFLLEQEILAVRSALQEPDGRDQDESDPCGSGAGNQVGLPNG